MWSTLIPNLEELYAEFPRDVVATIADLARSKTRPPMTTSDVLDALECAGLVRFPATVRADL